MAQDLILCRNGRLARTHVNMLAQLTGQPDGLAVWPQVNENGEILWVEPDSLDPTANPIGWLWRGILDGLDIVNARKQHRASHPVWLGGDSSRYIYHDDQREMRVGGTVDRPVMVPEDDGPNFLDAAYNAIVGGPTYLHNRAGLRSVFGMDHIIEPGGHKSPGNRGWFDPFFSEDGTKIALLEFETAWDRKRSIIRVIDAETAATIITSRAVEPVWSWWPSFGHPNQYRAPRWLGNHVVTDKATWRKGTDSDGVPYSNARIVEIDMDGNERTIVKDRDAHLINPSVIPS